ncbi:MAG: hypothetical protein AAF385_07810, partial [Pseudomonadota bacterium]
GTLERVGKMNTRRLADGSCHIFQYLQVIYNLLSIVMLLMITTLVSIHPSVLRLLVLQNGGPTGSLHSCFAE